MKQPIRFIYFDVDDTILDHRKAEKKALIDIHSQFEALASVSIQRLIDQYHDVNVGLWTDYGLGKIDRSHLELNRFRFTLEALDIQDINYDEVRTSYMNQYYKHWDWIDHARETMISIAEKWPIGFLTNGFAEVQRAKAQKFSLYDYSDKYIISEDVGFMKPAPEIFSYATKMAGVNPHEILYVGDSFTSDVIGASTFGWNTAWFTTDSDPLKKSKATFVFDDFRKLTELIENRRH